MKELKIGVIGSGGRGGIAELAHKPDENSRVVACCDADNGVLEWNREQYGAEIFTTSEYRELLQQELDAVFIATPDFLHEEMAVAALQAGKAVYLEKPLAITTEGCDLILRTAFETKAKLFLGHNMRHMPFVLQMKEFIESGAVGKVMAVWCRHFVGFGGDHYFKDWHAERKYSTGLLLQKAAHDIDIIHWLAGSYTQHLNALGGLTLYHQIEDRLPNLGAPRKLDRSFHGKNIWPPRSQSGMNATIDVEDISMMQMQLQNGAFAAYQQCHYTPDYWRNYCVIGDEGRLENIGNGEDGTTIHLWNQRVDSWAPANEIIPVEAPEGGHGGADPRIVAEFLRFVREGGKTNTSPLAARFSVAAGCAATDSLRDNGTPRDVADVPPAWWKYFEEDFQAA